MLEGRRSYQNSYRSSLDRPIEKWYPNFDSGHRGDQIWFRKIRFTITVGNTHAELTTFWNLMWLFGREDSRDANALAVR
jgi:hypothetical protein